MNKKISIIVPVYNCEKYISRCISSILNQTYSNTEILLINDGSTDDSLKICNSFKDKRIKVITKQNGGASSARNVGLDRATGSYISFVDADDYVDSKMIETLYENLTKYKTDIAICTAYEIKKENEHVASKTNVAIDPYIYSNVDMCLRMKNLENGNVGDVVWGKLYKKELFQNLRFHEGMINEDAVLLHELYYNCKKGVLIPQKLYFYCVYDENGVSRREFSYRNLDSIKAYEMRMNFYKDKNELLHINAVNDYITNTVFNYYPVWKYLKDYRLLNKMKKDIKLNYKIVKNSRYLSKNSILKNKIKTNVPFLYSFLLNFNAKRKSKV